MLRPTVNNTEFLAANLHGRRCRLAEGEHLDVLCRVPSIAELAHDVFPAVEIESIADFQRLAVQQLPWELDGFLKHLEGCAHDLIDWMLKRFQIENIKLLLRAVLTRTPVNVVRPHLASLPPTLKVDPNLAETDSLPDFITRLPSSPLMRSLRAAANVRPDTSAAFFLESTMDCNYLQELLSRSERFPEEEQELFLPLLRQEADIFHLMLITRGKFNYGLTSNELLPLHLPKTNISIPLFSSMLSETDQLSAATRVVGLVLPALPTSGNSSSFERLAWQRYHLLAKRAFRRSHMGFSAIVGYIGLRRIEVANLITLSEGIHLRLPSESIRARMIPRTDVETRDV